MKRTNHIKRAITPAPGRLGGDGQLGAVGRTTVS
jgi:hypothetical protein